MEWDIIFRGLKFLKLQESLNITTNIECDQNKPFFEQKTTFYWLIQSKMEYIQQKIMGV